NGGNAMEFAITTAAGGGESQVTAPSALPTGWHHVAITVDGVAGQLVLYLDGAVVAEGPTTTLPSNLGNTTQNWIGRSQYTADPYFGGSVDDFRIYSRALTEPEVRYLVGGP
ncbi:MAG: LamG domain-containing protein, partial [Sedimentisphaerales bacterium]|nr:LamG domain-containing protein [Sedimentisphaerales bacterium]